MSDPVSSFYERFPYPSIDTLTRKLPETFSLLTLNHLLRRPPDQAIPETARIWVPGCGTRQPAQVALRFPRATVIASDVSRTSLAKAQSLVNAVGVSDRVELELADLSDADHRDTFDLVFCTGVLHHLADPAAAANRIRRSLRPGGASVWMVYNRNHRRPFATFQRCLGALCERGGTEARLETGRRLLADILRVEANQPLGTDLKGYDQLAEEDLPAFADALVHPRETSFSPASLRAFVDVAGLRFVNWCFPAFWDPTLYLRDPTLRRRAAALDTVEQEMLIYRLGGYNSPFLDVLVERRDAPKAAPLRLRSIAPLLSHGTEVRSVDSNENRVGLPRKRKPFRLTKKHVIVTLAREGGAHQRRWALPRAVLPLLEAFDGRTSVIELSARTPGVGIDDVEALVAALLPENMGLVVPT